LGAAAVGNLGTQTAQADFQTRGDQIQSATVGT
jgi:hypothetical protein